MEERIPGRFRGDVVRRIGHGGEATVYELTGGHALRVYHAAPHGAGELASFYRKISQQKTSFALPEVFEQGEDGGLFYSVDRLIAGRPLHELMPHLEGAERERALTSYADAVWEIASLPYVRDGYGEFLRDDDSIMAPTWSEYLVARMHRSLNESASWLSDDVPGLAGVVAELERRIEAMPAEAKVLVHGDYFPGNVLIGDDLQVSGVIDFGPLTVMGEQWLDLASAAMFIEVVRPGYRPEDMALVQRRIEERAGARLAEMIVTYRGWYAVRFSPYRDDDPNLYRWCVESLRGMAAEM